MTIRRGPFGPVILVGLTAVSATAAATPIGGPVFINEFHYDNAGADSGEFIELAGVAGTDLTGWSLYLYNGASGQPYDHWELSGVLADDTGTGFGFHTQTGSLQNGAPDGIALLDGQGQVQEFLSYEGILLALGGPAEGLSSRDVLVGEGGATPVGASLQRLGVAFSWQAMDVATPGGLNEGQQLMGERSGRLPASVWPLWLLGGGWLLRRRRRPVAGSVG
jgi:hypothetical protein